MYLGHQTHSPAMKDKETNETILSYKTQNNNQQKLAKLAIHHLTMSKVREE